VNTDSPESKDLRDILPIPLDTLIPNVLVAYGWYFVFRKLSPKLAVIIPVLMMAFILLFLLVIILSSREKGRNLLGSTIAMALFAPLAIITLIQL
jgi:hypothetical protein